MTSNLSRVTLSGKHLAKRMRGSASNRPKSSATRVRRKKNRSAPSVSESRVTLVNADSLIILFGMTRSLGLGTRAHNSGMKMHCALKKGGSLRLPIGKLARGEHQLKRERPVPVSA